MTAALYFDKFNIPADRLESLQPQENRLFGKSYAAAGFIGNLSGGRMTAAFLR
ncbi:MAG: hypothetical protein IJ074_01310 [Clostridia bacterium]|nr:hypothetical protein [Clostridia bacterium]